MIRNQLLAALRPSDWTTLHRDAEHVRWSAGHTFTRPGDIVTSLFFPTSGIVSVIISLETGESLDIAAVGTEGVIGIGAILQMQPAPFEYRVQVECTGYRIAAEPFERAFATSDAIRRVMLVYIGRIILRAERGALCNRFHTRDRRLARWLLVLAAKSGQRSLYLTHDGIAQMVGGPRPAVTAALRVLRERGAITYSRGRIDITSEERLAECACACEELPPDTPSYG
jgi:CRP-like cAMP-binding protein